MTHQSTEIIEKGLKNICRISKNKAKNKKKQKKKKKSREYSKRDCMHLKYIKIEIHRR